MSLKALDIQLLQKPRSVTICYDNGVQQHLSCDKLRHLENSPASINTQDLTIVSIDINNDMVCFRFNDGHISPYYSWPTLFSLGNNS